MTDILNLNHIRSVLVRLEETIIFNLIERAQFKHNQRTYKPGLFETELLGWKGSWLEWILLGTESFQSKARRYESPDEYPFNDYETLPKPVLPPLKYPEILHKKSITNVNEKIMNFYVNDIVPSITNDGDDENYGSSATRDVETLQAVSRRVHYGMFVSESKFLSDVETFTDAIKRKDIKKLEDLITKPQVEAALLERLKKKAQHYGQDYDVVDGQSNYDMKVKPEVVVNMYKDHVIPLTKEVEVSKHICKHMNKIIMTTLID